MKEENEDIIVKCDFCDARAVANLQKIWVKFKVSKDGRYKRDRTFDGTDFDGPDGEDNIHLCKKCEEKWLEGGDLEQKGEN